MNIPVSCTLCPRRCKADRTRAAGFCGAGPVLKVARAALHYWEEPCISGTHGSDGVFFRLQPEMLLLPKLEHQRRGLRQGD